MNSSTPRVKEYRERAAKQGLKRKEYLITDAEHAHLRQQLKQLRASHKDN